MKQTDRQRGSEPTVRVVVTDRAPSHRVGFVDQLLGDTSRGTAPEGVEFEFRGNPLAADEVDVIYLTAMSAAIGDRKTPERARIRRAKQFARALKRRRIALVRPLHQLAGVAGDLGESRAETILHNATALYISDAPQSTVPHDCTLVVIRHSHLRSRFLGYPRRQSVAGRVLLVATGTFPPTYEGPLKAFALADLPDHTLRLVGQVPDSRRDSFARTVAQHSARISLRDAQLSDAARVDEISAAELVIIPDPDSRGAQSLTMLALSLDRPVLVQATGATNRLADEVGGEWVRRHEGPLTAAGLETALEDLRRNPPTGQPHLDAVDPSSVAIQYADAFRAAAGSLRRSA